MKNDKQDTPRPSSRDNASEGRKEYTAPSLTEHGSLEAITKGGVDPIPPLGWIS